MTFKEIIVVYSEKNTKPINTIFVQKSELLKVKEASIPYIISFGLLG
jgi:hypothetical protein